MNIERIVRAVSCFLFLTGYQIYWYDHKKLRYHLTVVGTLYYLILFFLYLICFCQHFEDEYLLMLVKELSPFLYRLVRFQVFSGLTVLIIQIFESKNLRKLSNSLVHISYEEINAVKNFDVFEVFVYLMLFATFLTAIIIGLYIAIELEFALPPLDHFMLGMALFMPHFALAGSLRLYTLGLWLAQRELVNLKKNFKAPSDKTLSPQCSITVEVLSPVINPNCNDEVLAKRVSQRLDELAEFFNLLDSVLQRQLALLMSLNFNCLLAGVYCYVNYENTWKELFTARYQRIFYAANSGIFVCILMDYGSLLFSYLSFCRVKQSFYNMIEQELLANNQNGLEMQTNLKIVLYKLLKKLKLEHFCLVRFDVWNFVTFQGLMVVIIALIVSHQYLNDQIKMLNENFAAYATDLERRK